MRPAFASALAALGWIALSAAESSAQSDVVRLRDVGGEWLPDARAAQFFDDGRLVVLAGRSELLVYNTLSTRPRRIGRDGKGPGEFELISTIGAGTDDTVHALDAASGVVSSFGTDGRLQSTVQLTPGSLCCSRGGMALRRDHTRRGSVHLHQTVRFSFVSLVRQDSTTVPIAVDIAERAPEHHPRAAAGGSGFSFGRPTRVPWAPEPMIVLAADRLYHGTGLASALGVVEYATGASRQVPLALRPQRLTLSARRALRTAFLRSLKDPEAQRELAHLVPLDSVPTTLPAFDRMLAAPSEGVWLRLGASAGESGVWQQFSLRHGWALRCVIPQDWVVLAFGTRSIAVTRLDRATDEIVVEVRSKDSLCS